jgi:hypothetical protein
MTRLRFIKDHGNKKAGDTQDTESPTTVMWLVERHKVAVIEPDNPIATPPPAEPVTDYSASKYLRTAPRDKMQKSPVKAKNWWDGSNHGD